LTGGRRLKVAVIEPLGIPEEQVYAIAKEELDSRADITYFDTVSADPGEQIRRAGDAEIVIDTNIKLTGEAIRGFKNCKLLDIAFTGVDHVDMDTAKELGIVVSNCAGYSTACVSDLVFGMLISLMRNISQCDTACRNCGTKDGLVGNELEGKRFGVIGTGAIGMRVAKIADAFGCEVVAYSRTVKNIPYIQYMSLDEVMSTSDIISLHMPNNSETKGMISREKIGFMKPNAILVNLARGPVLDSQALADALNEDKIAGACIDVFEMEPPIPQDHPLIMAKHTIVTPHVAFASREAMVKRAHIVFENAAKYIDGTPQNVIK
jgi:phosphoglycerate dehydrogenase-like enzyme